MPFTIGGDYVPDRPDYSKKSLKKQNPKNSLPSRPIKVFLEKRKNSSITVIKNLPLSEEETIELTAFLKKKLGVGGSYKGGQIEIQGNKIEEIKKILQNKDLKF